MPNPTTIAFTTDNFATHDDKLEAFIEGMSDKFDISHPDNVAQFSRHLEKRTGIRPDACRVEDIAHAITMPTLLVQVHQDWRTKASSIEEIHDRVSSKDKQLLWIEDEQERLEGYTCFARKPEELITWLIAH